MMAGKEIVTNSRVSVIYGPGFMENIVSRILFSDNQDKHVLILSETQMDVFGFMLSKSLQQSDSREMSVKDQEALFLSAKDELEGNLDSTSNHVIVIRDSVLEFDTEEETAEPSLVETYLLRATHIYCRRGLRDFCLANRSRSSHMWLFVDTAIGPFMTNYIVDVSRLGEMTLNSDIQDMQYLKKYADPRTVKKINSLYLSPEILAMSMEVDRILLNVDHDQRLYSVISNVAMSLSQTFRTTESVEIINREYSLVRYDLIEDWTGIGMVLIGDINQFSRLARISEMFYYYPTMAISALKDDYSGVSPEMAGTLVGFENSYKTFYQSSGLEFSMPKDLIPATIGPKLIEISKVIIKSSRGFSGKGLVVVVVPDFVKIADLRSIVEWMVENLGESARALDNFEIKYLVNGEAESGKTMMMELSEILEHARVHLSIGSLVVLGNSDFEKYMCSYPSLFSPFIEDVHLFPLKYTYSTSEQARLVPLFRGRKSLQENIHVYFGNDRMEMFLATAVAKRKFEAFREYTRPRLRMSQMEDAVDVLADYQLEVPVFSISPLGYIEPLITDDSRYLVQALNVVELQKMLLDCPVVGFMKSAQYSRAAVAFDISDLLSNYPDSVPRQVRFYPEDIQSLVDFVLITHGMEDQRWKSLNMTILRFIDTYYAQVDDSVLIDTLATRIQVSALMKKLGYGEPGAPNLRFSDEPVDLVAPETETMETPERLLIGLSSFQNLECLIFITSLLARQGVDRLLIFEAVSERLTVWYALYSGQVEFEDVEKAVSEIYMYLSSMTPAGVETGTLRQSVDNWMSSM